MIALGRHGDTNPNQSLNQGHQGGEKVAQVYSPDTETTSVCDFLMLCFFFVDYYLTLETKKLYINSSNILCICGIIN